MACERHLAVNSDSSFHGGEGGRGIGRGIKVARGRRRRRRAVGEAAGRLAGVVR